MCILYLQTGSEFEEKLSNMLYACEEKEEQLSVSHGVLLCFCQRVEELEKENALLKSEKEEINLILQQSQTSAGNNGAWSNTTLQTQSYFRFS